MEQLSLLQKIYLYGETLSSEELNQIVLYLNSSIEAINTLIARNNNINEGHCEMRYKVSAQLPEAPESGTDGKSDGWSDTYTKPDTDNGEITWMTLSFFNGEGVYGAWSTPVCITWGSVRGQAGPKGESGLKGSFKSRVFKRSNATSLDRPTGGTYDNPIPSEGGWTDGIPTGKEIIWSSVCTFYGNGLSSGWSIPAPESDNDTLDIEFSPNAVQPEPPTGDTPYTNHESEGWYDPSSNNFNIVGTMVWRAERKVSNGVYNGDWTITRIVGEKGERGESGLTGGHYEFRYNNFKPSEQASAPTKPSNGSNGTTGGWTTSQETLTETLIKEGYATWMTQCYQNEASIYNTWTDPIRITGANGYDGADGNEIEFVYTRNNTGETPAAPPTTQQDDWYGTLYEGTANEITWTDNPLGVLEDLMYEYVSLRAKINDVWSAYSTPVIWSKWGEKGMDGDGFEYIYKRFQTVQNWASITGDDNPANWKTNHLDDFLNTREYLGPTGKEWNDDPQGIDETYKYEYVSVRLEIDGVWYGYSTPTLWSGMPGVFLSRVFTRTNDDISNVTPSGGTYANPIPNNTVVGSGQNQKTYVWSDSIPSGEAIIWSSTCMFNGGGSSNGWSKPLKESDTANLDIEFTDANSANGSAAPAAPSGSTPFSDHSSETPAWYDPSSIPANKTMVWRAERKVANGVYDGNWVITRIRGEKGEAGTKGNFKSTCFKRTNTDISGTTPTGGTYDSPVATGWSDGIPSGTAKVWATSCIFYGAGGKSAWSTPRPMTDTDTYDVEFAKMQTDDATPAEPDDTNRHGGSGTQIWFDPVNDSSEDFTAMYWRAERECKNGVWGSWIIVRIKGEKGDLGINGGNYEFRYANFKPTDQASAPTEPDPANSGTIAPWSATQSALTEELIKDGYKTWMTYCFKTAAGTYGTWTDPIRITGANGLDGEDGSDVEFIYHRDSSATAPDAPTASHSSNSKVFSADDWFGKDSKGVEWTDNPSGVTSSKKYEYVAVREKPAGKNQSWGAYHVALWSKWGEKGMDGDGFEYIYKHFGSIPTWGENNSNPAHWDASKNNEYTGPNDSGWTDDPQGVDSSNKYEYVSVRKKVNGTWGKFSTPTMWAKFAIDGVNGNHIEFRYKNAATRPDTPSGSSPSGWSAKASTPSSGEYTWMSQSTVNGAGTYGAWSTPIRITGNKGEDGADGSDVEFIYTRNNTGSTPSAPTASGTGNTKTFSGDDWYGLDNNGITWTDNPVGVESTMKYEYVAVREKPAGKNQSWGAYHVALWSKWGEKGMDGDGFEYIYKHFSTEQTWGANDNNPNNWAANQSREYYGPTNYTWSDDPNGVDSTNKYEYVSVRQRVDGTWGKFSTPVLWSNYAEAKAAVPGPPGNIGPMSYLAGIWDDSTTYTKSETANPIVYRDTRDEYYYIKEVGSPTVGVAPETSNSGWIQAENYNMVFTDILFVNDFAKLGSFIVNKDWMISQFGIIYDSSGTAHKINSDSASWTNSGITYVGKVSTSGQEPAYSLFDPYHPNIATKGTTPGNTPNFVPYAAINAKTGESYFSNTHITGEVTANSGSFNGIVNASGGVFNGIVNATLFKAGDDNGFSITTSPDSLDFNYNGNRLAFFSLRSWDATNNQLADVSDNPTGFYLYMTNPLNGHLITIDFTKLSFKDLNENQVLRHEATFYSLSNRDGKAVETPVTLYYSLENNTTKWWLHSDSATELTSSEMGTLYKKQQVNQRGVSYGACVQEVDAGTPYITTGYTLYELQTLQNNAPTKNGNYAMATYLNNDGSSSTDKWFVVPNSTTYLNNLNTNWSAVFRLSDGRVNETTATTVKQSSNHYSVPTFNFAVSFINCIDENRNVVSILYPF